MTNWKSVIAAVVADRSVREAVPVICPPATPHMLELFEHRTGKRLPTQMRELYSTANGFGFANSPVEPPDFVKPLDEIHAYATQECDHYGDTHPEFAAAFLPFIDLGNGDAIGYVWDDPNNADTAQLVLVSHEAYEYDSKQDLIEFVRVLPSLEQVFA